MALYGVQQLIDGMRAVRANTIAMAEDIPEAKYGFRATPGTRSIAETFVHIAWLLTSDMILHEQARIVRFSDYQEALGNVCVAPRVPDTPLAQ